MDSLQRDIREWRRAAGTKGVLPLTFGIAGLGFLVAYVSDLLARASVGSIELVPGWFTLRPFEHGATVPFPVLVLGCVLLVLVLAGATPVASARLQWWTRRRWAIVAAIAIGSGGALSNLAEWLQKGSVTDFLLIHDLDDFSVGDFLMIAGYALALVLLVSPDYVGVRKRHIVLAIGVVVVSIVALPLMRSPLNHLLPLGLLLAGVAWLTGYLWWRVSVGNRLLGTLASDVPGDPGTETNRVLEDLELALQRSTHIDLAASAWALDTLAYAYRGLGRPEDLRRTSDAYLRTAEEVKSDRMKAWALDYVGAAHSLEDVQARANLVWQESLVLANQQGDDRHKLLLLANIAWAEGELDRADDAQRTYASALDLAERLGNTEMASRLRNAISLVRPSESGSAGTSS